MKTVECCPARPAGMRMTKPARRRRFIWALLTMAQCPARPTWTCTKSRWEQRQEPVSISNSLSRGPMETLIHSCDCSTAMELSWPLMTMEATGLETHSFPRRFQMLERTIWESLLSPTLTIAPKTAPATRQVRTQPRLAPTRSLPAITTTRSAKRCQF